jgi:hypothetical protein
VRRLQRSRDPALGARSLREDGVGPRLPRTDLRTARGEHGSPVAEAPRPPSRGVAPRVGRSEVRGQVVGKVREGDLRAAVGGSPA